LIPAHDAQRGIAFLETLITIVIVALGLLGLAALHGRMQAAEMEAYQRAQATVLLRDAVDRLHADGKNAMSYVTAQPLGTGRAVADCSALVGPELNLCEWNNALLGANATAAGNGVGAMIGARGCIEVLQNTMPRQFRVSVAWQGLAETAAPQVSACGAGSYGDERRRRVAAAHVVIACLENDAATGACVTP